METRFKGQQLWVRVNPLQTPLALEDLAGVMGGAPDGIMLPKCDSAAQTVKLDHYLCAFEARESLRPGSTKILPVATETPRAMFALDSYAGASGRLVALTWGAEDLSTAVGASTNRLPDGEYEFTYKLARALCLLGAHAAGVAAIDTVWTNFRDAEGLAADSKAARRAGSAFSPDEKEIAAAQRVIDAFAAAKGAGAVQLDGRMLDKPHLTQAQKLLALAAQLRD